MLPGDEFPTIVLVHGIGADCAVGFALCRDIPIILLLLVIVAQFTLTLRGHAALGLQHLFCFIRSWLVSLICVKILKVRASMRADLIEIAANGVMSLGHSADTRVKIGERPWTSHHWHGFSSRGWAKELAAFIEVIQGAIDFFYLYVECSHVVVLRSRTRPRSRWRWRLLP